MRFLQNLVIVNFLEHLQAGRYTDALALMLIGGIEVSPLTYNEYPGFRAFVEGFQCPVCLETGDDMPAGQYPDWRVAMCHHVFCEPCAAQLMVRRGVRLPRCPVCRARLAFYFA